MTILRLTYLRECEPPGPRCREALDYEHDLARSDLVVGRAPGVDLHLPYPSVGREVLRIWKRSDGAVWIEDLGSGNPSRLLRNPPVERPDLPLTDGDELVVGPIVLRIRILSDSPLDRPAAEGE